MSEYVTFEFRKSLDRGYGGNFGAYTFIMPLPCFLNIFLDVLSAERILKQNKNTLEFPRINTLFSTSPLETRSSVQVQSAK